MRPWERMLPQAILQAADNGFDFRRYDSDRNCRLETYELGVVVIAAHPPVAGGNTECATCGATRRSGNYGACFEVSGIEFCANIAGLGEGVSTATAGLEIFHLLAPDFSGDFYGSGSGSVSLMGATIDRWREDLVTRYHLNPWHKMLAGWVEPLIVPILPQIPPASARLTAPGADPQLYYTVPFFYPRRGFSDMFLIVHRRGRRQGCRRVVCQSRGGPPIVSRYHAT